LELEILKPVIAGGALAFGTYYLFRLVMQIKRPGGRLTRFAGEAAEKTAADAGSRNHKIRLVFSSFGLDVAGNEGAALFLAWLGAGTVLALILLVVGAPLLMLPAAYVAAWFLVDSRMNSVWVRLRHGIEREIPVFLTRLGSTVQIESNVLEAVHEVAETLDSKGPLKEWMLRFIARCQAGGAQALGGMLPEAQAVSTSLGIAVFEIGRLWETGGPGYVKAFNMAAENIGDALKARALAHAKGDGAKSSIRMIVLALIGVMVFLFATPQFAAAMQDPAVQILYAFILGWMFFGWSMIDSIIEGAI
jgi:Flp pilus assembly protein TadB